MEIQYLGHSSFKLKGKVATVITDPFDPKMVGLKFPSIKADIVTVSHDHKDHNYIDAVKEVKRVISGPGEYEISDVSIIGISSYHDDKKGEERGKNTIYVFEVDDVRIVHLGDLGHTLSEKKIESLGNVNVLIIPVGGIYTIGYQKAAEMVRKIEPNITIPMHYLTAGMNKSAFGQLDGTEAFLKEVGLPVENMDKLSIKSDLLGEDQKVVVLKPAA
jgi:L-ascorbate metabolism protein UlaG (beta-lactamase superfamily)